MSVRHRFLYRPPGGKTLHALLVLDRDCSIVEARITGDFFVYPEEAIEALEEALKGCRSEDCIRGKVAAAASYGVVVGFTWSGLAERLAEEWGKACRAAAERQ